MRIINTFNKQYSIPSDLYLTDIIDGLRPRPSLIFHGDIYYDIP
jgi:hypothetical protein